jgi:hypothetical protein
VSPTNFNSADAAGTAAKPVEENAGRGSSDTSCPADPFEVSPAALTSIDETFVRGPESRGETKSSWMTKREANFFDDIRRHANPLVVDFSRDRRGSYRLTAVRGGIETIICVQARGLESLRERFNSDFEKARAAGLFSTAPATRNVATQGAR